MAQRTQSDKDFSVFSVPSVANLFWFYNSPRLRSSAMWRALRTASAAIVRVGFFSENVVKQLPSTTNRFLISCDWQYEF